MWLRFLSFHHKPPPAGSAVRQGWIRDITNGSLLVAHGEGNSIFVHAPSIERIPHLHDCVRKCSSFRVECDTCCGHVCKLALSVDTVSFKDQVESGLSGEVAIVELVAHVVRDAYVPLATTPMPPPSMESRLVNVHWNDSYPLFAHQEEAVQWMRSVEADVHDGRYIEYSKRIAVADTGYFVDVELKLLTDRPKVRGRRFRGGLLCDGTGLGKTATALYLATHADAVRVTRSSRLSTYTSNLTSATLCTVHDVPFRYLAKGTLIIVPINLPAQWAAEVDKFVVGAATLRLITGRDIKGVTMTNLLEADVVLTTFNFLRSAKYTEMVEEELRSVASTKIDRASLAAWARSGARRAPIIEAVYWRRMIVDEIHEVFENNAHRKHLALLNAHTLWGLTATPWFRNPTDLYFVLDKDTCCHEPHLVAAIFERVVRGTPSKDSEPTNQLRLVNMSAEERILYQAQSCNLGIGDIIRFCSCFPPESEEDAIISDHSRFVARLDQIHRMRAEDLRAQISECDASLLKLSGTIDAHRAFLSDDRASGARTRIADLNATSAKELLALSEKQAGELGAERARLLEHAATLEKSMAYVKDRLERFTHEERLDCTICMERTCDTITRCGHVFCKTCIVRALRTDKGACPLCRVKVKSFLAVCTEATTEAETPNESACVTPAEPETPPRDVEMSASSASTAT